MLPPRVPRAPADASQDVAQRRAHRGTGSGQTGISMSSAGPLTPRTASPLTLPWRDRVALPVVPPISPTFSTLMRYPDRHLVLTQPGPDGIAPDREIVRRHVLEWYEARRSETDFDIWIYQLVDAIVQHPWEGKSDRAGTSKAGIKPLFKIYKSKSIKHYGTIDAGGKRHPVHQSTFAKKFRETYLASGTPVPAADSDPDPDSDLDDDPDAMSSALKNRLDTPDLVLTASSMSPAAYYDLRLRLAGRLRRQAKKPKTGAMSSATSAAAPAATPAWAARVPSPTTTIVDSDLWQERSTLMASSSSMPSSKKRAWEDMVRSDLDNYFAIVGLVCEMKTLLFFKGLCQLLGYLWQLYTVCGTVLGLLINGARYARVIVLPPTEQEDLVVDKRGFRVAIETGKREWWGRTTTMEDLDSSVYRDSAWIPHRIYDDEIMLNWPVIERLVRHVELARDVLKAIPLDGICTEDALERGHRLSTAALRALEEARSAAGEEAGVHQRERGDEVEPSDSLDESQSSVSECQSNGAPFVLDLCKPSIGAIDGDVNALAAPTASPIPVSDDVQRAVDLIAKGARRLRHVPPPRNVALRKTSAKGTSNDGDDDSQPPAPGAQGPGGSGSGPGDGGHGDGAGGGGGGGSGRSRDGDPPNAGDSGDPGHGGHGDGSSGLASGPHQLTRANLAAHDARYTPPPREKRRPPRSLLSTESSWDLDKPYMDSDADPEADAGTDELWRTLIKLGLSIVFVSPGEMDRMTERMSEAIAPHVATAAPDPSTATSGLASANVATAAARTPPVDPIGIVDVEADDGAAHVDAANGPAKAPAHPLAGLHGLESTF